MKIFSNTVTYSIETWNVYYSAVIIAGSKNFLNIKVLVSIDSNLIQDNLHDEIRKCGWNFILHTDNASYYRGSELNHYVKSHKGI